VVLIHPFGEGEPGVAAEVAVEADAPSRRQAVGWPQTGHVVAGGQWLTSERGELDRGGGHEAMA
jgi:hypothetical protein